MISSPHHVPYRWETHPREEGAAFQYAIKRGWLTQGQIEEARRFGKGAVIQQRRVAT